MALRNEPEARIVVSILEEAIRSIHLESLYGDAGLEVEKRIWSCCDSTCPCLGALGHDRVFQAGLLFVTDLMVAWGY